MEEWVGGRRREGKDGVNTAVIGKFWFQAEKPNKLDQKKKKENFIFYKLCFICYKLFVLFFFSLL